MNRPQLRRGRTGQGKLLVLLVNDRGNVRGIGPTVALRGEMEREVRVFGVTRKEQFKESVDILTCDRACVDSGPVRRVRIPNVDGLV